METRFSSISTSELEAPGLVIRRGWESKPNQVLHLTGAACSLFVWRAATHGWPASTVPRPY